MLPSEEVEREHPGGHSFVPPLTNIPGVLELQPQSAGVWTLHKPEWILNLWHPEQKKNAEMLTKEKQKSVKNFKMATGEH